MEVSDQLHVPGRFILGRGPQCPWVRMLGGPQSLYGNFGEEKNILPLTGFESPIVQPVSLVTILTAAY